MPLPSILSRNFRHFSRAKWVFRVAQATPSKISRPRLDGIRAQLRTITGATALQSRLSRSWQFLGSIVPRAGVSLASWMRSNPLKALAAGLAALGLPIAELYGQAVEAIFSSTMLAMAGVGKNSGTSEPEAAAKSKASRHFEILPGEPTQVSTSQHSGGFPEIVHGGLIGSIGIEILAQQLGFDAGKQPSKIQVRLNQPLKPGGKYTVLARGDAKGGTVEFREAPDSAKPLAIVKWGPNGTAEEIQNSGNSLQSLEAAKSGEFKCIDSCVTFGENNPEGLHLSARYRLGEDGKAEQIWAILDEKSGRSLREQLMAMDELGWWMGTAFTGELGVTVKYDFQNLRPESQGPIIVLASRPQEAKKITEIPLRVLTANGAVVAQGKVSYVKSSPTAQKGMGGEIGGHFHSTLAKLQGRDDASLNEIFQDPTLQELRNDFLENPKNSAAVMVLYDFLEGKGVRYLQKETIDMARRLSEAIQKYQKLTEQRDALKERKKEVTSQLSEEIEASYEKTKGLGRQFIAKKREIEAYIKAQYPEDPALELDWTRGIMTGARVSNPDIIDRLLGPSEAGLFMHELVVRDRVAEAMLEDVRTYQELEQQYQPYEVTRLWRNRYLNSLESLQDNLTSIRESFLRLAESSRLENLTRFDLSKNSFIINNAIIVALLNRKFPYLRILNLAQNGLEDWAVSTRKLPQNPDR